MPSPTPDFITLKEALSIIASGDLFSIRFVTANRSTMGGGQWRTYEHCTRPQLVRAATPPAKEQPKEEIAYQVKNPKHYENSTRNIKLPDGSIKKVHIRLIRQLNGRVVL